MRLLEAVDPRLLTALAEQLKRGPEKPLDGVPLGITVVLAGHRAAGKTKLGPLVAEALGRPFTDLDAELARVSGRDLKAWVTQDVGSFRVAERSLFEALPMGRVVAVGGGFLATHPEALRGTLTVLVPISFETYVDRLLFDQERPRLAPHLSLIDELREVFFEREQKHMAARPMPLVELCWRLEKGPRPRRVVTLPPDVDAYAYAWAVKRLGADMLEVRTDLIDPDVELRAVARALPLLVAERGKPAPAAWRGVATLIDEPHRERGTAPTHSKALLSHHAQAPLSPDEAAALWSHVTPGPFIKHVEPLGGWGDAARLLETQARLKARFGVDRVTVLAMGPVALPLRSVLAVGNSLDYLAVDERFMAAKGQRLLADARREAVADQPPNAAHRSSGRLALVGSQLSHAQSPRMHAQPFDRIDWPAETEVADALPTLAASYRGLAITSPFKAKVAAAVGSTLPAVNTLVRVGGRFVGFNTDDAGAHECLRLLGAKQVTVLGRGGVAWALETAARARGVELTFRRHGEGPLEVPVSGAVVWAWPAGVAPPPLLRFETATVAVIAYGAPARALGATIVGLGGQPLYLGARWLIAQAREQRKHWSTTAP